MNGWVAPGCSKPLPWIGPLTISFGRSKDMKYGIIESSDDHQYPDLLLLGVRPDIAG